MPQDTSCVKGGGSGEAQVVGVELTGSPGGICAPIAQTVEQWPRIGYQKLIAGSNPTGTPLLSLKDNTIRW